MLKAAVFLCFLIGVIHSCLGERFILVRLFRGSQVPHLLGSDVFTKRTLRFAWHITTIAWWGLGYIIWTIATDPENLEHVVLYTVGSIFVLSGIFAFGFTGGKHLSWVIFWAIAGLVFYVAMNS